MTAEDGPQNAEAVADKLADVSLDTKPKEPKAKKEKKPKADKPKQGTILLDDPSSPSLLPLND